MCSQWNLMKTQTRCDSFSSVPCRLGFCTHSQRGALCSWAQLLAHNSSFYVPLFLPVSMLVSPRKEVAAILPAGYAWVRGGRVCCENRVLIGYQLSLTLMSLQCGIHNCWLLMISTLILTSKCLSRIHFYFKDFYFRFFNGDGWMSNPLCEIIVKPSSNEPKMYSTHFKNTLHLLVSPQHHSSPLDYLKLITCHCILILSFVMQT